MTRTEQLVDAVSANDGMKVLITSKAGRRQISAACRDVGGELYQVMDGRHWFEDVEILVAWCQLHRRQRGLTPLARRLLNRLEFCCNFDPIGSFNRSFPPFLARTIPWLPWRISALMPSPPWWAESTVLDQSARAPVPDE